MNISFKFSVFNLEIKHLILKELGEFTIFCLKAISDRISLADISNIVQIDENNVKRQLSFALSRKYLDDNYCLTMKGTELIELFNFLTHFNEKNLQIALEHYIENSSKQIYSIENKNFTDNHNGYLIKDKLYDYKVKNSFYDIVEKDKEQIKSFLIKKFPKYEIIIEKYLEDFIFQIEKEKDNSLYYNYKSNDSFFINKLKDNREKGKDYISVEIPILEVNKFFKSDFLDEEFVSNLKSRFDNFKYFNLITGDVTSLVDRKIKYFNLDLKLDSKLNETDIVKKYQCLEKFTIDELLLVDIKTEVKRINEVKFLNIIEILGEL